MCSTRPLQLRVRFCAWFSSAPCPAAPASRLEAVSVLIDLSLSSLITARAQQGKPPSAGRPARTPLCVQAPTHRRAPAQRGPGAARPQRSAAPAQHGPGAVPSPLQPPPSVAPGAPAGRTQHPAFFPATAHAHLEFAATRRRWPAGSLTAFPCAGPAVPCRAGRAGESGRLAGAAPRRAPGRWTSPCCRVRARCASVAQSATPSPNPVPPPPGPTMPGAGAAGPPATTAACRPAPPAHRCDCDAARRVPSSPTPTSRLHEITGVPALPSAALRDTRSSAAVGGPCIANP
jgi:hypothetical protein